MKKLLIIVGVLILILLAAAIILPIVFKNKIKEIVAEQANEYINAQVRFDDFGLSLFRNFPNATASLYGFSVVNNEPFEGDTLVSAGSLRIAVNLWSLISGDQIRISEVALNDPTATIIILENGAANYDIALEDDDEVEEDEDTTEFSVGIDKWVINNGRIAYADLSTKLLIKLDDVNHKGSGDFTQDIFDMKTYSEVGSFGLSYDGVEYISDKKLEADVEMNMNMPEFRFTFRDNEVKLNDFAFDFEGWLAMPDDDIEMNISFAGKENSFKSLLSLVPGMYSDSFNDLTAEGTFAFNGAVKGVYNDSTEQMPAINLNLSVKDGMAQYSGLNKTMNNIRMDLAVAMPENSLEQTVINLKDFHMDFGNNPIDAKALIEGLETMKIDADINAKANLADFNDMLPLEGLSLKGLFEARIKANGVYDSASSRFPQIEGAMSLADGYIKTADFPSAIENLRFVASVTNPTGQMKDTEIQVNNFGMSLDGDQLTAQMYLKDLDNYKWDVSAKGAIDLEKVSRIMELEDMTLKGKIAANIQTKGQMADVDAGRYDRLPTSGEMSVTGFYFESGDLPQGFAISQASAVFNPNRIELTKFAGMAGSSDLSMNGYLTNYIGYMVKENETIKGELSLHSEKFDANEWMTGEEEVEESDTTDLEIVEIPANIDLTLNSTIDQLLYDNLSLNNLVGKITVKDKRLNLDNLRFNLLGGEFSMTGYYGTQDPAKPAFDFNFKVDDLSVKNAYQNFNTVKALAPIAQHVDGDFSTNFNLGGRLLHNMMPDMASLSGKGLIELADAALKDSKIVSGIASLTSQSETESLVLKDIKLNAEVNNGRLHVQPFDFKLGNIPATASGSNGLDGSLDYLVGMDIPAGQIGETINQAIASLGGPKTAISDKIRVNLKVGGEYNNPKVSIASTQSQDNGGGVAADAKEAVKEKVEAEKEVLKEEVREEIKEKEAVVQEELEEQKEKAKEEVSKEVDKAKERLKKLFK